MKKTQSTKSFNGVDANLNEIREKYERLRREDPNNPIATCLNLIASAAMAKDPEERIVVSRKISEFLIRPSGLIELFLALIDFDPTSQHRTTHTQRFMAIATIIVRIPNLCVPYEQYCQHLAPQILSLVLLSNTVYWQLASCIVNSLIEHSETFHSTKSSVVISCLFGPIKSSLTDVNSCHASKLTIEQSLLAIHHLVLARGQITSHLIDVTPNMFEILCRLRPTASHLKPIVVESLVEIISKLKPGPACCLIDKLLLFDNEELRSLYQVDIRSDAIGLKFSNYNDTIRSQQEHNLIGDSSMPLASRMSESMLDIICKLDMNYKVEIFFHFLENLSTTNDNKTKGLSALIIKPMLDPNPSHDSNRDFKSEIFEAIIKDKRKSIYLITRTLERYCDSTDEINWCNFKLSQQDQSDHGKQDVSKDSQFLENLNLELTPLRIESMLACIEILSILISTPCTETEFVEFARKCLPTLEKICQQDEQQPNLAYKAIIDKTKLLVKNLHIKLSKQQGKDSTITEKIAIEQQREYEEIVRDINDPLMPARVHALIKCKRLILSHASSEQILSQHCDYILNSIMSNISDEEPYVFLAAINALAAMAMKDTPKVLPNLLRLYGDSSENLRTQERLNVGEVLVRLSREMGQMAPYYGKQVIPALLASTSDSDELIRSSSLVNIGQISANLGFALSTYVTQILLHIRPILQTDTIQVKRAAIDLLRQLLSGLNAQNFDLVQEDLSEIYKLLKMTRERTLDETLNLLIQLAIDEMNPKRFVETELSSTNRSKGKSLVKNIRVVTLSD